MDDGLRAPRERTCERCGRHEVWSEAAGCWQVATDDGDHRVGRVFCVHEWDVTGSFTPVEDA